MGPLGVLPPAQAKQNNRTLHQGAQTARFVAEYEVDLFQGLFVATERREPTRQRVPIPGRHERIEFHRPSQMTHRVLEVARPAQNQRHEGDYVRIAGMKRHALLGQGNRHFQLSKVSERNGFQSDEIRVRVVVAHGGIGNLPRPGKKRGIIYGSARITLDCRQHIPFNSAQGEGRTWHTRHPESTTAKALAL